MLQRTRLLRPVRFLGRPVPDLIQFNLILVLSHWPLIVDGTLRDHPLHFVAHAVLVGSALLMWLPVCSPLPEVPQARPPTKMLYLFLQTIVPTVPASFLTFGSTPLYHFYEHVPRLWGISALTDMQMAGLIMKIVGGFYLWAIIGVMFAVATVTMPDTTAVGDPGSDSLRQSLVPAFVWLTRTADNVRALDELTPLRTER